MVAATTKGYGTADFAPGLIIIGSDGYGNLLGIDAREGSLGAKRYLRTDALAIGWDEQSASGADYAHSLIELLQIIAGWDTLFEVADR